MAQKIQTTEVLLGLSKTMTLEAIPKTEIISINDITLVATQISHEVTITGKCTPYLYNKSCQLTWISPSGASSETYTITSAADNSFVLKKGSANPTLHALKTALYGSGTISIALSPIFPQCPGFTKELTGISFKDNTLSIDATIPDNYKIGTPIKFQPTVSGLFKLLNLKFQIKELDYDKGEITDENDYSEEKIWEASTLPHSPFEWLVGCKRDASGNITFTYDKDINEVGDYEFGYNVLVSVPGETSRYLLPTHDAIIVPKSINNIKRPELKSFSIKKPEPTTTPATTPADPITTISVILSISGFDPSITVPLEFDVWRVTNKIPAKITQSPVLKDCIFGSNETLTFDIPIPSTPNANNLFVTLSLGNAFINTGLSLVKTINYAAVSFLPFSIANKKCAQNVGHFVCSSEAATLL